MKALSEEELKSFETWLQSPWCNSNKNLLTLLEKLKKHYPEFSKTPLTKEKLFRQVLPKGKFSERRINNLLSEAYLAVERFLIFNNLKGDPDLQRDLLTKEWQSKGMEERFLKETTRIIDRLESKERKEWEDHLDLLRVHRRIYHHAGRNPRFQTGSSTITKMGEQLDMIYLLEKAAIINEKIFRNRILKNEEHDIQTELKKWTIASDGVDDLCIAFYKKRFEYSTENMLQKYLELCKDFFARYQELNTKDQKAHLISLLNDTHHLVRAKLLDITDTLPLYKLGLKTKILFHQENISYKTYIVIVAASNTKGDFDFTLDFIARYTKRLEKKYQKDAIVWAKAHTFYRQKELTQSLDFLLTHEFSNEYFQLISRVLKTQLYFDLYLEDYSYQSYLFNYFDSFEKWILRGKSRSKFNKTSFLRFVQVARVLAKAYADVNFRKNRLEKLLDNEKNIQAIEWLQQKVQEVISLKK